MKLGVLQMDVARLAPRENIDRIFALTRGVDVDLLVLPEMCLSGYLLSREEAREQAMELPGDGIAPFVELANELDAHVVAGVIEKSADALFNTALVTGPSRLGSGPSAGWVGKQRKVHITDLERSLFERGSALSMFDVDGVKTAIVTCFDSWFPESVAAICRAGAQVLCQPAAFGGTQTLDVMRVRSLENRVYSATANRLGDESVGGLSVDFRGASQIVGCSGETLETAGDAPRVVVVDIDPDVAKQKSAPMCADLHSEWALDSNRPPSRAHSLDD